MDEGRSPNADAAQSLSRCKEMFRAVLQALPDAAFLTDVEYKICYASPPAHELLGFTVSEELAGRSVLELVSPAHQHLTQAVIAAVLEHGDPATVELVLCRNSGEEVLCDARASVLRDGQGSTAGCILLARDVTCRCQQERLIRLQRDLAIKLNGVSNLDQALNLCLDAALELGGMDCGGIYRIDPESAALDLVCSRGLSPAFIENTSHFSASSPNARLVYAGKPFYVPYCDLAVPADPIKQREGLRFVGVLPIAHEGRIIACLNVGSHTRAKLEPLVNQALETLAAQIGSAIARVHAEEQWRAREASYNLLADNIKDVIWTTDLELRCLYVSPSVRRQLGLSPEELVGASFISRLDVEPRELVLRTLEALRTSVLRTSSTIELDDRHRDGRLVPTEVTWSLALDGQGSPCGYVGVSRDISERRRVSYEKEVVEEQLRQAQKMDAVGTLAGGIAHDFNNVLTAIRGTALLMRRKLSKGHELLSDVEVIDIAAEQATELTQQLLGFARKGKRRHELVDLHCVVDDVLAILRHTIDRRITIETSLVASNAAVMGDPSQLRQVLLNLAVNARDAMPEGGTLSMSTRVVTLGHEVEDLPADLAVGEYVIIAVADTGIGISESIKARIFDPFFTTKQAGGSGMGLAVAYGIVANHGGAIGVKTEEQRGSEFVVYLPLAQNKGASLPRDAGVCAPKIGKGLVLVVDDEELVARVVVRMLETLGFGAVMVGNGKEAVAYYRAHGAQIDVVLLDLEMPVMAGKDCLRALKSLDPEVRVIACTGHAAFSEETELTADGAVGIVQKPYALDQLSDALAKALHA